MQFNAIYRSYLVYVNQPENIAILVAIGTRKKVDY